MDIPDLLQARAHKLGVIITVATEDQRESYAEWDMDEGEFILRCGDGYHVIWDGTLPAEGIADALNCLEREDQFPDYQPGAAWHDFGKRWGARWWR